MKRVLLLLMVCSSAIALQREDLRAVADGVVAPFVNTTAFNDPEICTAIVVGIVAGTTHVAFGYGAATPGGTIAPDGDSIFQIGSVSKVFTGLILARMILDSGGLMRINDAVITYLHDDLAVPAVRDITLGELVSHYGGFPAMPPFGDRNGDGSPNLPVDPMSPASGYSRRDLAVYLKTFVRPEKKYRYSNIGIGILAIALADTCGAMDYHDMLSTNILRDLGMDSTWGEIGRMDAAARGRVVQGYMYATTGKQKTRVPGRIADMGVLAGAGAIVTTANDMCKFVRALTGAPTALNTAVRSAVIPMGEGAEGKQICYGIDREIKDGVAYFRKLGVTPSYTTYLLLRRDVALGVIVLANAGGFRPVRTIGEKIMEQVGLAMQRR